MSEPDEGPPKGHEQESNQTIAEVETKTSSKPNKSITDLQAADSKSVAGRLRKVRKMLFPESHPERSEKVPVEEITEAKVAQTILDYRPGHNRLIRDNSFSSNDIMIQLGWEGQTTPEEMQELATTTNRHLSNLISAGGLKAIPIQDKDGRVVQRNYQVTDTERAVLENIVKNSTQTQQPH